jgi:lipopolysaccharide transport system permease protein
MKTGVRLQSPLAIFGTLSRHRDLIWQMTKRDVIGRYRGSIMGLLWSFFNPVLMLAVYTFIFSVVFQARWGEATASKADFAIVLFVGLIIHTLFAECVNRSPSIVLSNVNYVKKVVFPLEVLPWITLGSALFHALISVLVLLVFVEFTQLHLSWTALLLPLVLLPFVLLIMGVCWFLASLGVFIRDVGQITGMVTTVMMFLSPIFYPMSSLPESYRVWLNLNPLTFIVEQGRAVLLWGNAPDWIGLGLYTLVAVAIAYGGLMWFQMTRRGFADVI